MRTPTLFLAAGESWEAGVLAAAEGAGVHVLKRCVDLADLMAAASLGQARVAVVSVHVPRLDAEAVRRMSDHDVAVVAVGQPEHADRATRLGAGCLVGPHAPEVLAAIGSVLAVRSDLHVPEPVAAEEVPGADGRTVVVWGPVGSPGRTTIAAGIAAEVAAAGQRVVLVDADPYGGCVATRLGVLDEASGLLVAARSRNAGTLDRGALARSCRRVAARLEVLTGLPRADRRIEVRPEVMGGILEVATELGHVVVDVGFCLEEGDRDRMTHEALAHADEIVVVGTADPVGLARLARGLLDLREHLGPVAPPTRIVLNRFRPGHGWSLDEVVAFLADYSGGSAVLVVPEDTATLDRSVASGSTLVELGASSVRSAVADVAAGLFPEAFALSRPKRRRAGRARRR